MEAANDCSLFPDPVSFLAAVDGADGDDEFDPLEVATGSPLPYDSLPYYFTQI